MFGSVSVWAKTGLLCCSSGAAIEFNDGNGEDALLLRTSTGGFVARVNPGPNEVDYSFTSSTPSDWHQFEIDTDSSGVTFKFDGSAVFTNASVTEFRNVFLQTWGGPGGSEYFDDFNANFSPVVPEPSSVVFVGIVLTGLFFWSRGRRAC